MREKKVQGQDVLMAATEKGRAEGIEEASHTIALTLLSLGLTQDKVAQATGLSISELEELEKQIH